MDGTAIVFSMRASNGVAWHGHHRDIAWIDETSWQHGQCRFATNAVIDLSRRIQLHLKLALHESTYGLFKLGRSVVHIPPILGSIDFDGHLLTYFAIGHGIVFANSKVEQSTVGIF